LGQEEHLAFEELKASLCRAANESLQIVDFQKPLAIHVDASDYEVAGILTHHLMMMGQNVQLSSLVLS